MYLVRVEKWACWYCMIRGKRREDEDGQERGTHTGRHFQNVYSRNNMGSIYRQCYHILSLRSLIQKMPLFS